MCLAFQPPNFCSVILSTWKEAYSSSHLFHFILASSKDVLKCFSVKQSLIPSADIVFPSLPWMPHLCHWQDTNLFLSIIIHACSSSPLPSHKLPEDENKVIHLYIKLVLSPLLFSLCPLSSNDLTIYNFIHQLHADAPSPDLSSHLPMWHTHMGVSRALTLNVFGENSS